MSQSSKFIRPHSRESERRAEGVAITGTFCQSAVTVMDMGAGRAYQDLRETGVTYGRSPVFACACRSSRASHAPSVPVAQTVAATIIARRIGAEAAYLAAIASRSTNSASATPDHRPLPSGLPGA